MAKDRIPRPRLGALLLASLLAVLPGGCHTRDKAAEVAPTEGSAARSAPLRSMAVVPLTLDAARRMYVQADLGGGVRATLLVDTGNGLDYLSTSVGRRLRLPTAPLVYGPARRPTLVDGERLRWVAPKMTLGGTLRVEKVAFVLRTPARLPECPLTGRPVDGIVGAYLLRRFDVLFDTEARQMSVWFPPGMTEGEIRAQGLSVLHTVPIVPYRPGTGVLAARVRLTDHGVSTDDEMVIDTGATVTVVSRAAARRLGLAATQGKQAIVFQSRLVPVGTDRVSRLQTGDLSVSDLSVCFPTGGASYYPVSLGMDVLGGQPTLIDFSRGTLYLVARAPPDPVPTSR